MAHSSSPRALDVFTHHLPGTAWQNCPPEASVPGPEPAHPLAVPGSDTLGHRHELGFPLESTGIDATDFQCIVDLRG